jgi:hypothetical protein
LITLKPSFGFFFGSGFFFVARLVMERTPEARKALQSFNSLRSAFPNTGSACTGLSFGCLGHGNQET